MHNRILSSGEGAIEDCRLALFRSIAQPLQHHGCHGQLWPELDLN